jgi:hypothetical protein
MVDSAAAILSLEAETLDSRVLQTTASLKRAYSTQAIYPATLSESS